MLDIDRERGDARSRSRRGRRDHERFGGRLHDDEQPQQLRRVSGYVRRDARDRFAQRRIRRRLEEQRAQSSGAIRDGRTPDCPIEPDRAPRIDGERQRISEPERGEQRREIAEILCGCEEGGCVAE